MKKEDFKVGQNVYIEPGTFSRDKTLTEEIVSKVGIKYVTVGDGWRKRVFNISDGLEKVEYGDRGKLYLSKQDIEDKHKAIEISREISKYFSYNSSRIPLNKLIKIKDIIDND